MERRLLDASGNVISVFHYDETEDQTFISSHIKDVEPIFDEVADAQTRKGWAPSRDFKLLARLDPLTYQDILRRQGISPIRVTQMSGQELNQAIMRGLLWGDYGKFITDRDELASRVQSRPRRRSVETWGRPYQEATA